MEAGNQRSVLDHYRASAYALKGLDAVLALPNRGVRVAVPQHVQPRSYDRTEFHDDIDIARVEATLAHSLSGMPRRVDVHRSSPSPLSNKKVRVKSTDRDAV
ncbi:MAG: hypothetical protein OXU77_17095, partial [Gammaproteobacteria bacterium]|nr:hypothetical protein [Gammaproteobacteria bacterium]